MKLMITWEKRKRNQVKFSAILSNKFLLNYVATNKIIQEHMQQPKVQPTNIVFLHTISQALNAQRRVKNVLECLQDVKWKKFWVSSSCFFFFCYFFVWLLTCTHNELKMTSVGKFLRNLVFVNKILKSTPPPSAC